MNNWLSLEKEQQIELFVQAGAITELPFFAPINSHAHQNMECRSESLSHRNYNTYES
ncbi:MAG: hypothetical protein KAS71_13890 [Bacteroidales bacterium]|nr:hypothetical protein [Bacteroidales bacterium]